MLLIYIDSVNIGIGLGIPPPQSVPLKRSAQAQNKQKGYWNKRVFLTIGNSYTHEKYIAKDFVNNRALFNEKRFPLYEFRILNRGLECYLSSSCNGIELAPFSMLNLDLLGKICG